MSDRTHSPEETKSALHDVVVEMYDRIVKGEPPTMTLPVRTKNNITFNTRLGVYKYGKSTSVRDATSLRSAKQLLRALHVVEFIEEMIDAADLAAPRMATLLVGFLAAATLSAYREQMAGDLFLSLLAY